MMVSIGQQPASRPYKEGRHRAGPGLDLSHGFLKYIQRHLITDEKEYQKKSVVKSERRSPTRPSDMTPSMSEMVHLQSMEDSDEVESTPCLNCSLRGGRHRSLASLILPQVARLPSTWSENVALNHPRRPGRGRAKTLREHNRRRESLAQSRGVHQDDILSSSSGDTGSSHSNVDLAFNISPDQVTNASPSVSVHSINNSNTNSSAGVEGSSSPIVVPETDAFQENKCSNQLGKKVTNTSTIIPENGRKMKPKAKFRPLDLSQEPVEKPNLPILLHCQPAGAENETDNMDEFNSDDNDCLDQNFSPSLETRLNGSMDTECGNPPEVKETNVSDDSPQKGRPKKSKKKFLPLDLSEGPVEKPQELLYGVPAGAETFGNNYGAFRLATEVRCTPEFGYAYQKQPRVHSVLDFPMLPDNKESKQQVKFMNEIPKSKKNMKTIASFVVRQSDDGVDQGNFSDCDEDELSQEGATVILENVPGVISKKVLQDLLQTYGKVRAMRTERRGNMYTAYARMDPEEAHWAADILDESDTLIPSGEEGVPLHVYVLTMS